MAVLQPPRLRKAPIDSHFCSSFPCSNKLQMESTPPHESTKSQLIELCLQTLQMHPAASRLSSSSDYGAAIKETSKGIPCKSRITSRATKLGRAKLQMVEQANRRFQSLFDLSKSRSSDKSCTESVHSRQCPSLDFIRTDNFLGEIVDVGLGIAADVAFGMFVLVTSENNFLEQTS